MDLCDHVSLNKQLFIHLKWENNKVFLIQSAVMSVITDLSWTH